MDIFGQNIKLAKRLREIIETKKLWLKPPSPIP